MAGNSASYILIYSGWDQKSLTLATGSQNFSSSWTLENAKNAGVIHPTLEDKYDIFKAFIMWMVMLLLESPFNPSTSPLMSFFFLNQIPTVVEIICQCNLYNMCNFFYYPRWSNCCVSSSRVGYRVLRIDGRTNIVILLESLKFLNFNSELWYPVCWLGEETADH